MTSIYSDNDDNYVEIDDYDDDDDEIDANEHNDFVIMTMMTFLLKPNEIISGPGVTSPQPQRLRPSYWTEQMMTMMIHPQCLLYILEQGCVEAE